MREKRTTNTTTPKAEAENKSLALGSCYSSLADLETSSTPTTNTKVGENEKSLVEVKSPRLADTDTFNRQTTRTLTPSFIETDENGWRLVYLIGESFFSGFF